MTMQLIRGSEVSDFTRCRWRWKKSWIENLKPIRPNGKLFMGNLFHKFVEVYYENLHNPHPDDLAHWAMQKLFQETNTERMEQVELDELWDLACEVTKNYVKQWGSQDSGWTVIAQELTFAIPIDDDIAYTGTIDLIVKNKDGRLFFLDHKTSDSIDKYAKAAEMDRQISRYWWAMQQLAQGNGYILSDDPEEPWYPVSNDLFYKEALTEPAGFIYNVILKDYPKPPKQLKPTKATPIAFSIDKRQMTSYKMYADELKKHGLIHPEWELEPYVFALPEGFEYTEILDHLAAQETETGNRFFQRIPVTRQQGEIDSAMHEFYAQATEAVELKKKVDDPIMRQLFYRNIQPSLCNWDCDFRSLCIASMDGSNIGMLQNLMYEQKEDVTHAELPKL